MATKRDYYEVLGVNKSATAEEIKTAYRKLAREHHPDVNKTAGAAARFKEISEAYQVLSDAEKNKTYDQFGHAPFAPGGGAYGGAGGNPFGGFKTYSYSTGGPGTSWNFGGFEDPFDLFEQIFGGMGEGYGGGRAYRRSPTYELEIGFDEAIHGATKNIEFTDSNGKQRSLSIKIPAGVDNGTRMRFEGIELVFRVRRHQEFLREGSDIFTEAILTLPQLVLGDVIEVNTVEGKVNLRVPPGTEPGSLIRLKGKGVSLVQRPGQHGDHYVRIKVRIPQKLSSKEKQLYEELLKLSSNKKGWF